MRSTAEFLARHIMDRHACYHRLLTSMRFLATAVTLSEYYQKIGLCIPVA